MTGLRVGILLGQERTTYAEYADAVRRVEDLGVDTIWDWDHFYPPHEGNPRGAHFEGWTLLAAMAIGLFGLLSLAERKIVFWRTG